MNAVIRLRCLGCDARIKAPAQLDGQVRKCPRCKHLLVVKKSPPVDCEPILCDDSPSVRRSVNAF